MQDIRDRADTHKTVTRFGYSLHNGVVFSIRLNQNSWVYPVFTATRFCTRKHTPPPENWM